MKASELIQELQKLIEKHDDLPIGDENGMESISVEYNDDDDPPMFIILV